MRKHFLAVTLLTFCFAAGIQATPITYFADLSGAAEFPPTGSPGFGTAFVTIDTTAHTLEVSAEFEDLMGTTTAAHIHCCTTTPFSMTAAVATQTPSFIGFPLGVTSGTFSNTYDLTDPLSYRAGFITSSGGTTDAAEAALALGLAEGRAYFNIHTSVFGGGEIRGFLIPVPEPGTIGFIVVGLGALAAVSRRRRA